MCQSILSGGASGSGGAGGTWRPAIRPISGDQQHRQRRDRREAAVGAHDQQPPSDGAAEDRDIGAGLDQAGAAEHFVLLQMLRQDRIFDRPEEGRMDAHREQGERAAAGRCGAAGPAAPTTMMTISAVLTMRMIRALSRESASWPASAENRKKGRMNRPPAIALNVASLVGVVIDVVDDEEHHRVLEQIVVERAEELGDEQRQEAPRARAGGAVSCTRSGGQRRRMRAEHSAVDR